MDVKYDRTALMNEIKFTKYKYNLYKQRYDRFK